MTSTPRPQCRFTASVGVVSLAILGSQAGCYHGSESLHSEMSPAEQSEVIRRNFAPGMPFAEVVKGIDRLRVDNTGGGPRPSHTGSNPKPSGECMAHVLLYPPRWMFLVVAEACKFYFDPDRRLTEVWIDWPRDAPGADELGIPIHLSGPDRTWESTPYLFYAEGQLQQIRILPAAPIFHTKQESGSPPSATRSPQN